MFANLCSFEMKTTMTTREWPVARLDQDHLSPNVMLNPMNDVLLHVLFFSVRRVPPRFSVEPEDLKVMPGSDVNLTCVAVGSPMPYVKWRQGAYDLTDEDEIPIGKNVLQLKDVRESKNYTCEASSDLGNIERLVQVLVEGEQGFVENPVLWLPRLVRRVGTPKSRTLHCCIPRPP